MNRFVLPVIAGVSMAAILLQSPGFKVAPIHTAHGRVGEYPSMTADGRHLYFIRDSSELWLYDRASGSEKRVLMNKASDASVSPKGERILFSQPGEDGQGTYIWTVALDPATGLARGEPRRVSLTTGVRGEFSPDASRIAFVHVVREGREDLVSVPADGGPERVLAHHDGHIYPIRWMPDASVLYYGLAFDTEKDLFRNGIYRIPSAGGTPSMVVRTADWGAYPGLSPDGRYLMYWEARTWDSVIVQTLDGRRVSAHQPQENEDTPDRWYSPDFGLGSIRNAPRYVTVAGANGAKAILTDTAGENAEPHYSPDGKRLLALRYRNGRLLFMNADGTSQRVLRLVLPAASNGASWSPDGRHVLVRSGGALPTLYVVAAGEDTVVSITRPRPQYMWEAWKSDSRAVLYATGDSTLPRDSIRTIEIHERALGGTDRVVGRVAAKCRASFCDARFIDDSLVVTWNGGKYFVRNFRRGTPPVLVADRGQGNLMPVPIIAADHRWIAIRRAGSNGQMTVAELVSIDGRQRRRVTVPVMAPGPQNPRILPGANELIVHSSPDNYRTNAVYRVNVATGQATKVFDAPHAANGPQLLNGLSPDYRTLAYSTLGDPSTTFTEIDIGALIRSQPRR